MKNSYNQCNMHSSFSDGFWDDQHKGVEIIFNKIKKSKETCDEVKKLYQQRAQIEQEYGDKLLRLAQSTKIHEFEEGTFAEALSHIPSALETSARAHIDLAQQLKDHLEAPLDDFIREQRESRKWQQQHIDNTKQLKHLHESDVARSKECYLTEYMKLSELEKYLYTLDESTDQKISIEKEIDEQKKMLAVADQVYRRSVDNLNSVNERWTRDWDNTTNALQDMEIKRIHYLKDTLCTFASLLTSLFSNDEECSMRIRTAADITDIQKDITDFVRHYGTGTQRPVPLSYESHYPSQQKSNSSMHQMYISERTNRSDIPINNDRSNPDEELKSVEHQRLRLESQIHTNKENEPMSMVYSPEDISTSTASYHNEPHQKAPEKEPAPITSSTSYSNGMMGVAMKEVEQALHKSIHEETTETEQPMDSDPIQSLSSDIMNTMKYESFNIHPATSSVRSKSPNNQEIHLPRSTSLLKNTDSPAVSPLLDHSQVTDDDTLEPIRMPRPPPKDEKWIISSFRKPQMLPVRISNGQLIDKSSSIMRMSGIAPQTETEEQLTANEIAESSIERSPSDYVPKLRRPTYPLTIDIPPSTNTNSFTANNATNSFTANNATNAFTSNNATNSFSNATGSYNKTDNALHSQIYHKPTDIQYPGQNEIQSTQRHMPENTTINNNSNYGVQNTDTYFPHNMQYVATATRDSSLRNNTYPEDKKSKADKPSKEGKSGRFSFFLGKKDRKKTKEKEAAAVQAAQTAANNSGKMPYNSMDQYQPSVQSYNQPSEMDMRMNSQSDNIQSPTKQQPLCYATALWTFEAGIPQEMSIEAGERVAIFKQQADGWWHAEHTASNGHVRSGLVPGNYMEMLPS